MKKIYSLVVLLIGMSSLFTSCGDNNEFTLKGTLGTKKGEKFLVVYDDPIAKIDTVSPIEGEFEYTFIPDTLTLIRLVNKEGHVIPIFADKGWEVNCKGTFEAPDINGNAHNHDYRVFLKSIEGVTNQDSIKTIAEKFIRKNPQSFASAYLIDRYFTQAANPNMQKVNSLITPLNGEVKDSRILNVAMKSIPAENTISKTSLSYFSLTDRNGKYISWSTKKGEQILINFWASWDAKSKQVTDSLYTMVKKLPNEKVKVLNISLDYDKKVWLASCRKDLDSWIEICNFKGWEAPIVKQNNILSLPSNILIDSNRTIIKKDISTNELAERLKKDSKKKGKK